MSGLSEAERATLGRIAESVREALGPDLVEIRLFGSRAEGTAREDSDYDLLVLVRRIDEEKRRRARRAVFGGKDGKGHGIPIQTVILSPEEFQGLRERELRIALDADRYGIAL